MDIFAQHWHVRRDDDAVEGCEPVQYRSLGVLLNEMTDITPSRSARGGLSVEYRADGLT